MPAEPAHAAVEPVSATEGNGFTVDVKLIVVLPIAKPFDAVNVSCAVPPVNAFDVTMNTVVADVAL